MTICPCCGFKSAKSERATLRDVCPGCGAHAVGEPLPRPERELPSFGRSLLLAVTGAISVIVFLVDMIVSLVTKATSFGFWSWVAAAETAAWHLKWAMIPVSLLVFFGFRRIYHSIKQSPAQYCAHRYARNGYFASATVPLLVLVLIGLTVPARLQQRQDGINAGFNAQALRIDRALIDYKEKFGTLPSELKDLNRLPDTDGSLALALSNISNAENNGYSVESEVAAAPSKKPRQLRGAVILNASVNTAADEPLSGGISFTNYQLRLPGPDKIANNEDDLIIRDGVTYSPTDLPRRGPAPVTQARQR
ncbi:MAG TPA: hypothetical protein VLL54_00120 [Pyrinomonadaceae bacterium]|nr:hypothetical protein [Pyrinomonadaceae bacterium]